MDLNDERLGVFHQLEKFVVPALPSGVGQAWNLLFELIELIGMRRARLGRIDYYPWHRKGGEGYTIYQPLTESFIVATVAMPSFATVDAYENVSQTIIIISSCQQFDREKVEDFLTRSLEKEIKGARKGGGQDG